MTTIAEKKKILRQQMRQRRQEFYKIADHNHLSQQFQKHFFELDILKKESIVAGYLPMGAEVSILSLMTKLCQQGYFVGVPTVTALNAALEFRIWQPNSLLHQDFLGMPCPPDDSLILNPTILLVPLIAFDEGGARLGQGGGFYDATLRVLRQNSSILTVGIAYEIQKIDHVPVSHSDEKLDYVITESNIYRV